MIASRAKRYSGEDEMGHDNLSEPAAFEIALAAMTDDEVFEAMSQLEGMSEQKEEDERALAFIQLAETEIERRFPGQALAPYKGWQRRKIL
jgi:hypothetical protein